MQHNLSYIVIWFSMDKFFDAQNVLQIFSLQNDWDRSILFHKEIWLFNMYKKHWARKRIIPTFHSLNMDTKIKASYNPTLQRSDMY